MKTKFKKQWTQAVAVAAAAVCAVTATCAGVTINHAAPMEVYALEAGTELTVTPKEYTDAETGDGCNYEISLAGLTEADAGEIIYVTFTAPKYAGQNLNGSGGYCDVDNAYEWTQLEMWTATADANGVYTVEIETNATMIKYGTLQVQCWYPNGLDVDSCVAVFGEASSEETTTTTTTTTTESSEEVTTTTTTDTTESSEDTTTTTTTASSEEKSTTTTTTTTKATTTTTKTTSTTASVTLETSIDFTQEKGDDGDGDYNAFVEFDPMGADQVRIVFKVSSSDTQATVSYGCWNNADGKWYDDENLVAIPTDKIVSYTDVVPAKVESTMKISIYYPKAKNVTIQDVVLIYDEAPVVTTTTEFESDLTFETITIGEATNKIDMLDRCYIIETIKGTPGYTISGGIYSGTSKNEYYLEEEWEEVVGDSSIIVKEYELRGQANASYGIFYYGKGTEKKTSAEVNIQTFYTGDASMNGKVNGSDVRAIVNYLAGNEKVNAKEVLCDYDDDGKASLTDAVTLTKALLGSYTTQALNS
jgi:hypothetical protein